MALCKQCLPGLGVSLSQSYDITLSTSLLPLLSIIKFYCQTDMEKIANWSEFYDNKGCTLKNRFRCLIIQNEQHFQMSRGGFLYRIPSPHAEYLATSHELHVWKRFGLEGVKKGCETKEMASIRPDTNSKLTLKQKNSSHIALFS